MSTQPPIDFSELHGYHTVHGESRIGGITQRLHIAVELCKAIMEHTPHQVLAREETVAEAFRWAAALMAGQHKTY